MKLIKTNKKYQQVTLNIEYEYKEDNTQINVEDTDILNTKMCVNDINKNIDLTKLSKIQLLEKCQEFGITKCKSKKKDKLIELINNKINFSLPIEKNIINKSITPKNATNNLLEVLNSLFKTYSLKQLAEELNVATGTITRWIELNDIPKNYEFDIFKLANIPIIYDNYSTKEKDQFFTPVETAQKCFNIFTNTINLYGESLTDFTYIEPSAGNGSFLQVLPSNTIALDIEPRHSSIIKADYLNWVPSENKKFVVFGNPPFGLRGHTALKFINHSHTFSEYVCFILPQLFESDGKGVPRKRVIGYNLIHSEKLVSNFYEPDGNTIKINTIFQIWSKHYTNKLYDIKDYTNPQMKIYSMSDGGSISSTRNKAMIGKCDIYIPSTCFGKENMKCYINFEDLPGKKGYGVVFTDNKQDMIYKMLNIEWNKIAFLSTNSAYNLRSSQIYSLFNF